MTTDYKPEYFSSFVRPNQVSKKSLESRLVFLALNKELETGTTDILCTDEMRDAVLQFSSVQLLEFSGMLTSTLTIKVLYENSVLKNALHDFQTTPSRVSDNYNLSWLFIQEMVVRFSNNMRAVYDELQLGLDERLLKVIITSPVDILSSLAEKLDNQDFINLKVSRVMLAKVIEQCSKTFAQDVLHTEAVSLGASIRMLEYFFSGHKCNDNRPLAGKRKFLSYVSNNNKLTESEKSDLFKALIRVLPDIPSKRDIELTPKQKMQLFMFHVEKAVTYDVSVRKVWDVTQSKIQFNKFYPTEID
jgi:hypothetical protein